MKKEDNNNTSISETTRKVFFTATATTTATINSLLKSPSSLFLPSIITIKGLYPPPYKPSIVNNIPIKSLSVPIKLLTMTEHYDTYNKKSIPMKKSSSLPISNEITFKKPTPIEALVTTTSTPRKSTSTTRPRKKQIGLKKPAEKKKAQEPKEDEEDEPMTKPLSLTEKRKRQAKRADQIKVWKVREEREAREARLHIRRQIVNGTPKKVPVATESTTIKKKKKRVKFNFDKNSIITIEYENDIVSTPSSK